MQPVLNPTGQPLQSPYHLGHAEAFWLVDSGGQMQVNIGENPSPISTMACWHENNLQDLL